MSDIQVLFERLNGIEATIAQATRADGEPLSDGAKVMLESLERRRDELREMTEELAAERLIDVFDYRVIPGLENRFPIKEVGQTLSRWQDVLTAFFAAVRENKPRIRATFTKEIEDASTLNWAYSYSGSLGIVMYVPNDQLLATESDLDIAVNAIMELVNTETVADVKRIADRFGKAAVKSFFDWSKTQTDADLSADIKWKRGKDIKVSRLVQPLELEIVQGIIKIADKRNDTIDAYDGVLVALNVKGQGSFKMSFADPELADVSGKFDAHFNWQKPHRVPARYTATLRKIVHTSLWSNEEKTDWELIELDEQQSENI